MEQSTDSKVAELLKPRYKVIADYPQSPFAKDELLANPKNEQNAVYFITITGIAFGELEKYPHLFKPLEWWEERKEKEMPQYLKFSEEKSSTLYLNNEKEPSVQKVKKHFSTNLFDSFRYSSCSDFISEWRNHVSSYGAFLPATESEYNAYLQTIKS